MVSLFLAACFFVGIHLFIAGTRLRGRLVGAIGEGPYLGVFSLLSLVGIVWLSVSYSNAGHVPVWGQLHALKPVAAVAMLLSLLFAVPGITTPNPTSVGAEGRLALSEAPGGMLSITRHPFLWGVAIWAITHLILNGDLASLILFGSLALLALSGTVSIDAKRAAAHGEDWDRFTRQTSNVPFGAILSGRARIDLVGIGWWRIAAALGVFATLAYFHAAIFGVSALPV